MFESRKNVFILLIFSVSGYTICKSLRSPFPLEIRFLLGPLWEYMQGIFSEMETRQASERRLVPAWAGRLLPGTIWVPQLC